MSESIVVTQDNFWLLAKKTAATETWPLTAPVPAIHLDCGLARLGDTITIHDDGKVTLQHAAFRVTTE